VQLDAFVVVLKVSGAHAVQDRSVVAEGVLVTNVPGWHVLQGTHAVAGFESWSNVPTSHGAGGLPASSMAIGTWLAHAAIARIRTPAHADRATSDANVCGRRRPFREPMRERVAIPRSAEASFVIGTPDTNCADQLSQRVHGGLPRTAPSATAFIG